MKPPLFKILLLVVALLPHAVSYSQLEGFGLRQFGNTIEEPFHTALEIRQEDDGTLSFQTYRESRSRQYYDGADFREVVYSNNKCLYTDEALSAYRLDAFTAQLVSKSDTTQIDVRDYGLQRQVESIKPRLMSKDYLLFANDGYLIIDRMELSIKKIVPLGITAIKALAIIEDTIYFADDRRNYRIINDQLASLDVLSERRGRRKVLMPIEGHLWYLEDRPFLIDTGYLAALDDTTVKIQHLYQDRQGALWAYLRGRLEGLHRIASPSGQWEHVDIGVKPGVFIYDIFQDKLGDYWFGTIGQGLIQMYRQSVEVLNREAGLVGDNIYAIQQFSDGGVAFSHNCQGIDVIKDDRISHHLDRGCQGNILVDSQDQLWVATHGIDYYSRDFRLIRHYGKENGLQSHTVSSLFEDSQGRIWGGTRQCIHRLDGKDVVKYCADGLSVDDRFFNIVELPDGQLLLANTNNKLYSFDGVSFSEVASPDAELSHLYLDSRGQLWLATVDKGLWYYLDNEWSVIDHNKLKAGIAFLQEAEDDLLFGVTHDREIIYFDPISMVSDVTSTEVQRLTYDDGLPLINTNSRLQPAATLLQDGTVAFPNIHGAICIDPASLSRLKDSFDIIFYRDDTLLTTKELKLAKGDQSLSLRLQHTYLNPEAHIDYSYRIDNGNYQATGSDLTLKNLAPGNHTIDIRGQHHNHEWLPPISLALYVSPRWYQRPLVWLLGLLMTMALVYAFVRWRLHAVATQNQRLQAIVNQQTTQIRLEKDQLAKSLSNEKRLSHELSLSQQAKNRMYAQISHEFRSPLQAVRGYLDQPSPTYDETKRQQIKDNINNLLQISDEMLDLSKAEAGKLKARKSYHDIHAILREQISLMQPLGDTRSVDLRLESVAEMIYVSVDFALIQKVINNLLSNAIKYSPQNGQVVISTEHNEDTVTVKVRDKGPGIPKVEIPHLTTAYFQASNTSGKGSGIGLSLAEEILKLHDSHLVISSSLGAGSQFAFSLAIADIPPTQLRLVGMAIPIAQQLAALPDRSKPMVLAVDDSMEVLTYIRDALRAHCRVIISDNALAVVDQLSTIKPDVILSDVNMPIMTGISFLKTVRSREDSRETPFLFLTGSASEETTVASLQAGANTTLRKPISAQVLQTQVLSAIKHYRNTVDISKLSLAKALLPQDLPADDRQLIEQLERVMLDQIANSKLKSSDLARALNIGEKTLRNRVKNITGYTIKEYLKHLRLEKAQILIDEGKITRGEIAHALGFSSLSYFSKVWKAWKGRTPR